MRFLTLQFGRPLCLFKTRRQRQKAGDSDAKSPNMPICLQHKMVHLQEHAAPVTRRSRFAPLSPGPCSPICRNASLACSRLVLLVAVYKTNTWWFLFPAQKKQAGRITGMGSVVQPKRVTWGFLCLIGQGSATC